MNYPKFKLGDTIKALKDISFSDGTLHSKNENFFVTTSNIHFFKEICVIPLALAMGI